jgi:hypothetical protein
MADEEELNLDNESNEDIISRKDKRLKSLNDSVRETKEELAKQAEEKAKLQAERDNASKERDFYKGFNQVATKYQGANEYQDKIWEKVQSGYDVEDATVAILNKEGKLIPNQPVVERESAIGGSANTNMTGGSKSPDEMSQAERRAALDEAFAKGDLKL